MHPDRSNSLAPDRLAALLDRAEKHLADQHAAYGTALDPDGMARAAWNTWRTLADLLPILRALVPAQTAAARHLALVPPPQGAGERAA